MSSAWTPRDARAYVRYLGLLAYQSDAQRRGIDVGDDDPAANRVRYDVNVANAYLMIENEDREATAADEWTIQGTSMQYRSPAVFVRGDAKRNVFDWYTTREDQAAVLSRQAADDALEIVALDEVLEDGFDVVPAPLLARKRVGSVKL